LQAADEVNEEVKGGRVGPLQVVNKEHAGLRTGEEFEENLAEAFEEAGLGGGGGLAIGGLVDRWIGGLADW